jgi:hypothetical protein
MLLKMNCDVLNVHKIGYDMIFLRKELGIGFYAWTWEKKYLNDLVLVDDFQS